MYIGCTIRQILIKQWTIKEKNFEEQLDNGIQRMLLIFAKYARFILVIRDLYTGVLLGKTCRIFQWPPQE